MQPPPAASSTEPSPPLSSTLFGASTPKPSQWPDIPPQAVAVEDEESVANHSIRVPSVIAKTNARAVPPPRSASDPKSLTALPMEPTGISDQGLPMDDMITYQRPTKNVTGETLPPSKDAQSSTEASVISGPVLPGPFNLPSSHRLPLTPGIPSGLESARKIDYLDCMAISEGVETLAELHRSGEDERDSLLQFMPISKANPEDLRDLEAVDISHDAGGDNNNGLEYAPSTSPGLPGSPAIEVASSPSIGTGSSSCMTSRTTSDEPFAAANMDRDAIGRSTEDNITVNDNRDHGIGGVHPPIAATLPFEVTDQVPRNFRERTSAPKSIHNTNQDAQTEAIRGIEQATTLNPDEDVGHFITSVSKQPICTTGRFGDLFIGIHKVVGEIAMKRIRVGNTSIEEEALRSFESEQNTWRHRPRHSYILGFLGTYKHGKRLYLVSRFIKNGNLLNYIDQYPDVNRVRLLCEVSEAVEYLHRGNIVHGDIKASNVLVGGDGHVLLCDFGLTQLISAQASLTWIGIGTPRWYSPEVLEGGAQTLESDVYAFSMTITEVLTGMLPLSHVHEDSAVVLAVYLRNERPEKTPMEFGGISYKTAWEVAEACWPKVPGDRLSMSEASCRLMGDPSLI